MNAVVENVYGFVKRFPPFSYLPDNVLANICEHIEVVYYKDNDVLFKEGESPRPYVYMVYKGAIELTKNSELPTQTNYLIDLCEEGDLLGLRALLSKGPYLLNAMVHEEALLYCMPADKIKEAMHKYADFANYVARLFSSQIPERQMKVLGALPDANSEIKVLDSTDNDFVTVKPVTPVVAVDTETNVFEAAKLMTEKSIGALLIKSRENYPLGIITEADLKRKVVALNKLPASLKVEEIMSAPVVTISDNPKVSDLLILAANKSIRHFCVTKDGTPQSEITGIVSERDLLAAQGNNPAVLLKKIHHCNTVEGLKQLRDTTDALLKTYLEQETALHFVLDVVTHINDAITEKCIEMAIEKLAAKGLGRPPVEFCWLSLGSEGRKEQLLRTDQDNAILYDNPTEQETEVCEYFLKLGAEVTEMLYLIGFEKCSGNIMASNKNCCRPMGSWKRQFEDWILSPEPNALLYSHIFFDLRPVYGKKELAKTLQEYIFELIKKEKRFISFLAYNATLNPVPLSFFRKFVVEKKGDFNDMFDIKARALMPISDAARVLAYDAELPVFGSTLSRFKELAKIDKNNQHLFGEICMAYEMLLRLRAQNAFAHQDDGRFVDVRSLNKIQRQNLKQIFSITEKLQQLLKVRFQTDYIR